MWHRVKISFLIFVSMAFCLASANPSAASVSSEKNKPLSISLEAGPDFKIWNAIDDNKKMILSGIHQELGHFFHEVHFGGWMGKDSSALTMYSLGISLKGLFAHVGYGYIGEKNPSLGTHWQFMLGAKYVAGAIFVGLKHFSNGSSLFNHSKKPNYSLNFITLGVTL